MFGYKRSKRQVEFGPYPLENLKRDENIIEPYMFRNFTDTTF